MSNVLEGTPSKCGWTAAEKLQLVFAFIPAKISWDGVKLPPGRTRKACSHVIQTMRAEMRNEGRLLTSNQDSGLPGVGPALSHQKAGKKRKAETKATSDDSDDDSGDDGNETPTPAPRKRTRLIKSTSTRALPAKTASNTSAAQDEEINENDATSAVKPEPSDDDENEFVLGAAESELFS